MVGVALCPTAWVGQGTVVTVKMKEFCDVIKETLHCLRGRALITVIFAVFLLSCIQK